MTLEEFHQALEEIAGQLPPRLFERLNGGVNIREQALLSPDSVPEEPRYILGQYHHYRVLGRWIDLYYGSFLKMFADAKENVWREEMDRVLRHELRHHMEDQAGETGLREEDEKLRGRTGCATRKKGRTKNETVYFCRHRRHHGHCPLE